MRGLLVTILVVSLSAGCTLFSPVKDKISQVGSDAKDLVSPAKRATLEIELDHPEGYAPEPDALNAFRSSIIDITGRDASHVIVSESAEIPAEPSKTYTWDEVQAMENAHRQKHTSGDTAVLYVLYLAGGSADDTSSGKVLGAAYHGTSIVIFKGNINANSGGGALSGKAPTAYVERAVLTHEAGHAMGLVNLGAPMVKPHEDTAGGQGHDPARRGHSTNAASVMYWAVENTGGLVGLVNCITLPNDCGIPFQFDGDDKADLRALRES